MMTTYDQWKTTDPREYERDEPEEDQPSELDLAYDRIVQLESNSKASADRIKKLEADLLECLEYFKAHYDVVDGDYGEQAPNKEMRLGTMIDETLYGIRF